MPPPLKLIPAEPVGATIPSFPVGPAVPIPTLPLAPSMERIGGLPTAVVVPIDQALTSEGIVDVVDCP